MYVYVYRGPPTLRIYLMAYGDKQINRGISGTFGSVDLIRFPGSQVVILTGML